MDEKRKQNHVIRLIQGWFMLGLEEEQYSQYNALNEYKVYLAKDNLMTLQRCCVVSYYLLAFMMMTRCLMSGCSIVNTVPFLLAFCGIVCIHACLKQQVHRIHTIQKAYILTGFFHVIWYALAFFFNVIIWSDEPGFTSCLAFVLLTSLFHARPKDNIMRAALAYAAMMICEIIFAPPAICLTDARNALLSMTIGILINQKNMKICISQKLYRDMYKTASKTSILVAQIDLVHNTFKILQSPDYMLPYFEKNVTACDVMDLIVEHLVPKEYRGELTQFLEFDTLSKRIGENDQLNIYFKDFRQRWCQLVLVEQNRRGKNVTSIVAIIRDVDEERRKEIEYQRQLNEAVEQSRLASAAKTSFLRRMSHDIRTPINGIQGMLEIAEYYENDLEKQKECRDKMREASGYLLSLVNNVLDMSKLESGTISLEHKPFCLTELFSEIRALAEMQAAEQNVRFEVDAKNSYIPHDHLIGSPVHVKQVMQNLVSNAIKYNRTGGSVKVGCRELSSDGTTIQMLFECFDTGLGMSEEFQKKAFEPFAQEGRKNDSVYAGTGLGLSIVREFVERMGGTVEMSSRINVGSCIVVILPFQIDTGMEDQPKAVSEELQLDGKRAMLVEDNELNAEIAEFILENKGFTIVRAVNGQDAVDQFSKAEAGYFDIIFMDIMMPVMDGIEATRMIRRLNREDAKKIPIIAMSANAFKDDVESCQEAGMNHHLMKPLDTEKLDRVIWEVLS